MVIQGILIQALKFLILCGKSHFGGIEISYSLPLLENIQHFKDKKLACKGKQQKLQLTTY